MIKEAKKKGLTISMDCQLDTKQEWTGENGHLAKMLPLLDVFMPSEYEAFGITKKNTIEESMKVLRKMMPNGLIIIKHGKKGVHFSVSGAESDKSINVPAFKVKELVDTTGAGDCFNAGFVHKWAEPKNDRSGKMGQIDYIRNAILYGCAAAKFCVENVGAYVDDFSKTDVDNLVKQNVNNKS